MASTAQGKKITEDHRVDQVKVAEKVASLVRKLFTTMVDYNDIDTSTYDFARRAGVEVMRFREVSRLLSTDYLHAFQAVEAPHIDPPVVNPPSDFDISDAVSLLWSTARGVLKRLSSKGYGAEEAVERASQAAAAKAMKIVGDGGREIIEQSIRKGHGAVGYARVVDADPCAFCAMLASRGVYYLGHEAPGALLYRSDSFANSNARFVGDGRFKVHDGCSCTLEPVYMENGKISLPGNGNQLAYEWAEIAAGQRNPMQVWRRWRERGILPENYDGPLEGKRERKAPVRRQKTGKRKRPTPQKLSERRGQVSDQWDTQRYRDYAEELEERAQGVAQEITELLGRGQKEEDISVMALRKQYERLLSHIEKYRSYADTL